DDAPTTEDPRRSPDDNLRKPYSKVAGGLGVLAPPPEPDLARFSPPPSGADPAVPSLPPKKQKKSLFGRGDKSGAPKKEKKDKKKAASDKGAQFIEFAALTPLLLLAALAVWQVLLFGITSMYA